MVDDLDKLRGSGVSEAMVQGERDAFGTPEELRPVLRGLKAPADLCVITPARPGAQPEQTKETVRHVAGL